MKILVVTNMYPTESNVSYGVFVEEQVESLKKAGVNVDVFFINGRENRINYFRSLKDLIKDLSQGGYDIVHAHHTYCVFPIRVARVFIRQKCPVMLTFHEGEVHWADKRSYRDVDAIKRLVFSKRIKAAALRMADLVITVQEELLGELQYQGKSVVMPCGVDVDLFRPRDKKDCRDRLNLPADKRIIFFPAFPGNKQKGFDILEKAIGYLQNDEVQLLTAGNVRHEEMPYYMSASDVIVQLSAFEASPSVVKEAMAANVPLVFTDSGDARKVMEGVGGCFVCARDPEEVAAVLKRALRFPREKCNGRDRIFTEGLDLCGVSRKIIGLYESLLPKEEEKRQ